MWGKCHLSGCFFCSPRFGPCQSPKVDDLCHCHPLSPPTLPPMSASRSLLAARTTLRSSAPATAVPALTSSAGSSRAASTQSPRSPRSYAPPGNREWRIRRPPRPEESTFFTAKAKLTSSLLSLHATREAAEARLRDELVWPLPKSLPHLDAPATAWKSRENMGMTMRTNRDFDNLISLLNKLHHMRFVSETAGVHDVAARIAEAIAPYQRTGRVADMAARAAAIAARDESYGIDELGRAYALGRRKSSSARVWIVPSQAARTVLAEIEEGVEAKGTEAAAKEGEAMKGQSKEGEAKEGTAQVNVEPVAAPQSEILVNHLPLPAHFAKVADREIVLRPLRVTGLLGAFNVFASVRGGGSTGQSGAIAHALAQAVTLLRPDAREALFNDGALARDVRVVERKKTNRPKARKGVSSESEREVALTAVHLGQALSRFLPLLAICPSSMHHVLDGERPTLVSQY